MTFSKTEFGWNLIRVFMYAGFGVFLIMVGDRFLIGLGVGLIFVAIVILILSTTLKVREDIRDEIRLGKAINGAN